MAYVSDTSCATVADAVVLCACADVGRYLSKRVSGLSVRRSVFEKPRWAINHPCSQEPVCLTMSFSPIEPQHQRPASICGSSEVGRASAKQLSKRGRGGDLTRLAAAGSRRYKDVHLRYGQGGCHCFALLHKAAIRWHIGQGDSGLDLARMMSRS